jgi:hypothetical protein
MIIFFLLLNNKMVRPRRLYKDKKGRYYYIINGKKKFIKVPKDMADKEVTKINLKTIEKLTKPRRLKKKKKRAKYKYEKAIVKGAPEVEEKEPVQSKLVTEGRKIPQIEDVVKGTRQKQLAENVEGFFSALAEKKPTLKGNAKFIQERRAKRLKEEEEEDREVLKMLPTKLRKIAKEIIESAKDYKEVIKIIDKDKFIDDPTEAERPFLLLVLNQKKYNLNEDEQQAIRLAVQDNRTYQRNLIDAYSDLTGWDPEKDVELDEKTKKRIKEMKERVERKKMSKEDVNVSKKPEAPVSAPEPSAPEPSAPEPSAPEPTPPATKPAAEQIRNIKKAIRTPRDTSGLMPSLRTPAKTTEQKLAETPSFSGTIPSGTEAPAAPLSTSPLSTTPMPESLAEKVRRELAIEDKTKELMGLGEGEDDDALYNDEIAKIIKKRVGKVVPVIPSDKVKYLKDYVKRGDKSFAAVINTNPSQSDGSGTDGYRPGHWRAIFIDNRDDYPSIEYFDPLVSTPEKELVVELKKIGKKMNPEKMFLYKENRLQRQAKEASTCGYHAAQFVDDRMNGESWCSATGYDDFVNRMGQVDDSADGEEEIRKTIKKYKVYL